jgi:hypothetical protein
LRLKHGALPLERGAVLGGWMLGKVKGELVSPYLVDWDALTEEKTQNERDAVLRIPKILSQARPRYVIVKREKET